MINFNKKILAIVAMACIAAPMSTTMVNGSLAMAQSANKGCPSNSKLTPAEIEAILEVHNEARAEVGVPPLKWNCNIASFAQNYINQGIWGHNPNTSYGENLAALGDMRASVGLEGPKMWYAEKSGWNNNTRKCAPGKVCGHYTQMVWRNSTEIGCGVNRNARADWGKAIFLVCNYNPAGNIYGNNGIEPPY
jgi:pathogenesis-related protein 1